MILLNGAVGKTGRVLIPVLSTLVSFLASVASAPSCGHYKKSYPSPGEMLIYKHPFRGEESLLPFLTTKHHFSKRSISGITLSRLIKP